MNQRNQSAKDYAETLDPKEYNNYIIWAETEIKEYVKFIKSIKKLIKAQPKNENL